MIDPLKSCLRFGHSLIEHTFLLADMDRCHATLCDCPGFVGAETEYDSFTGEKQKWAKVDTQWQLLPYRFVVD